eukprot:GHVT01072397.1.p1 GENE.GHVT01072397.1~~GHVT01072397.1.p1  ORF type:complete len:493 (-),score=154.41 GHVT01072397.1:4041-5519(-)
MIFSFFRKQISRVKLSPVPFSAADSSVYVQLGPSPAPHPSPPNGAEPEAPSTVARASTLSELFLYPAPSSSTPSPSSSSYSSSSSPSSYSSSYSSSFPSSSAVGSASPAASPLAVEDFTSPRPSVSSAAPTDLDPSVWGVDMFSFSSLVQFASRAASGLALPAPPAVLPPPPAPLLFSASSASSSRAEPPSPPPALPSGTKAASKPLSENSGYRIGEATTPSARPVVDWPSSAPSVSAFRFRFSFSRSSTFLLASQPGLSVATITKAFGSVAGYCSLLATSLCFSLGVEGACATVEAIGEVARSFPLLYARPLMLLLVLHVRDDLKTFIATALGVQLTATYSNFYARTALGKYLKGRAIYAALVAKKRTLKKLLLFLKIKLKRKWMLAKQKPWDPTTTTTTTEWTPPVTHIAVDYLGNWDGIEEEEEEEEEGETRDEGAEEREVGKTDDELLDLEPEDGEAYVDEGHQLIGVLGEDDHHYEEFDEEEEESDS